MAKYIDADLLIENIANIQDLRTLSTKTIGEAIRATPAADVVEVVRCKDCKHGHWNQETCHGKPIYYCDRTDLQVAKYSFCSYGERRTDDE